jgi:uncharacterized protein (DUF1684 family)
VASETGASRLYLADWRRRVSALYEGVRQLASADPAEAHSRWREAREALYRSHPSSPVPPEKRADFAAIHFPYDPSLRFKLKLQGEPEAGATGAHRAAGAGPTAEMGPTPRVAVESTRLGALALALPASTGEAPESNRIGWLDVPFASGARRLAVFWLREYSGGIFLPFRDGTNGRETYGGGRYVLDTAKGADLGGDAEAGTIVVDFNFAYQPSCAFDPRWSCPLAPPENRLDLEIRAGERIA